MVSPARCLTAFLVIVVFSGCVTGTIVTTVESDGSIGETEMELEVDEIAYAILTQEAADAGYEDIEERLIHEGEQVYEDVEYSEEQTDDGILITQTMSDGDPDAIESIDVDVSEDEILYVDHEGPGTEFDIDEEYLDAIELRWVVQMPGEVVDTNGELQEDNQSVEWTLADHGHLDSFMVASERPAEEQDSTLLPSLPLLLGIATVGSLVLALTLRVYRG